MFHGYGLILINDNMVIVYRQALVSANVSTVALLIALLISETRQTAKSAGLTRYFWRVVGDNRTEACARAVSPRPFSGSP
jgi:hypothetical protein